MEDLLENISKNSNPKDNFYIVVNDTESKIKNTFSPPLTGKGYEVALIGLCTYYSYPNVDWYNNTIYLHDREKEIRRDVKLPRGCYKLDEIYEGIVKQMEWKENPPVVIGKNKITLRASLKVGKGWSVEFPFKNSLGAVLGFESKTYDHREEPWISEKIVNILSVNSILIHCDMISRSMVDGVKSPVIYNYSPNVIPGSKIVGDPVKPIYLPVSKDVINELNIRVTDQENRLLDLQGEKIVLMFHMRER